MYVRTYVDINTSFPRIPIKMVSMTPSYMILRKCEQDIPIAAKSCKNMDGTIKNIDVWSPVTAIDVLKKNSLFTQRGLALQRPNSALATFRWKWTSNPSFIQVAHYCTWPTGNNTPTGQIRRTVEDLEIVHSKSPLERSMTIGTSLTTCRTGSRKETLQSEIQVAYVNYLVNNRWHVSITSDTPYRHLY